MSTAIIDQVVAQMNELPEEMQQEVLTFVNELRNRTAKGVPGKVLLPLAGTISQEDAKIMREAIEEGCEQVNLDEW